MKAGPAGEAVYRGRVDAMAFWDGSFARIEIAGFPLRQLPNSPGMQKLFGNCYGGAQSDLAKNRDLYVRLLPRHGEVDGVRLCQPGLVDPAALGDYPETKPKGKTERRR